MNQSLKQKTFRGFFWSAIEKFSVQSLQFLLGIILARLLSPKDYGLIGMLTIFVAVSQIFIDGGFSAALIQKKNRTENDFSTVLFFNIGISISLYLLLFISSPYIARFYDVLELKLLVKVIGLNLIINSLAIIQRTKFIIGLNFKTLAKSSFISVLIGGIVGVLMAYRGFGVWALVGQSLVRNILNTLILWSISKWTPKFLISKQSFLSLFRYGSNLLAASLIYSIFENIYLIVIGKAFSTESLGFYVKARNFANFPAVSINGIIQKVTFPVLSLIQENEKLLLINFIKLIRITSLLVFPAFILLAMISSPLIIILLTEKWKGAITLLQLLCFALIWFPINELNVNLFKAKGRSQLVLKLEIIKKLLTIFILIITFPLGFTFVIVGQVISSFFTLIISIYYTSKITMYKVKAQLLDIFSHFSLSFVIGLVGYFFLIRIDNNYLKLIIIIPFYIILYIFLSFIFFKKDIKEIRFIIKSINR